MKRIYCFALALALAIPALVQTGCGGVSSQEKSWEKDIPQVPPADRTPGRAPAKK